MTKNPKVWDEKYLAHMCKLSTIWADYVLSDDFDPTDLSDETMRNYVTHYKILAETFIELQSRAGMKPRFRMPAITTPHKPTGAM